MSFTTIFNIWRWWICRKLPIFASEEKPYRMKTIANIKIDSYPYFEFFIWISFYNINHFFKFSHIIYIK